MFGQRPAFGTSTAFGGFGTNTSTTGFGSSSFGRPVFGTPQTTAASTPFGTSTSTGTSLFGQTQPAAGGGGLFGSTTQSSGFGSTGFGTATATGGGGGLFGATTQTSNTGLFGSGTSTFNTQNQARPFSFGTPTTSAGNSLFGSSSTGTSLFGSSMGQQQPGTTVKYNPVTGTDTMNRGGTSTNIQTKIEVITAMKEYETKSLEELRIEDYAAGRKGGQAAASAGFGFGQNKFMTSQPQSLFGSGGTTNSLFGQKPPENKSLFGATPSFGTSTSGGGLFGSTAPTFGQQTTTASSGFSFGQANQPKPAAFSFAPTTSTQPLFGTQNTSTQPTFGSAGFGFPNQQTQSGFGQNKPAFGNTGLATSTGLFGQKPATGFGTGFGSTSTASPFGTTNTSTGLNLFGNQNQNKPGGFNFGPSTSGFGTNTGTGFGTGGIFGQASNQPKPGGLNFGTSGGFGTNTSTGFGFGSNTGTSVFGSTSGGLFGNTGTGLNTGTNTFGSSLGTGLGVNPLQPNAMNLNANNPIVNNNSINNLIKALTHNPFGNSSLLKTAVTPTGKAAELLNSASGPAASSDDASKPSAVKKPTYVLPSGSASSPKPLPKNLNGMNTLDSAHHCLFVGLEDGHDLSSDDPFKPKALPSVKKLNLRVFKNVKNDSQVQSGIDNSTVNGSCQSGAPTPLTTPLSSIGVSDTLPPSHENSPTPDIIKGRSNIKRLNIPKKNPMNDTLADFARPKGSLQNVDSPSAPDHPEVTDGDKENNISLFETSSIDNIPEAMSSSIMEPHPTGIKLTRTGYYTLPSLNELSEMIDDEGKCLVENFTIGRYGYGNVCFPGITNVYGLDLDAIVFIVRKEVEIYPEGSEKPPKGEGLNKTAFVTLDCVWPVDKSNRDIIKSEERLASMGWSDYLERQCLKMDATFVEYRPETGSWLFKVKHFSKYGLQEEDDAPATGVEMAKGARAKEKPPIDPTKSILATQLHATSPRAGSDAPLAKIPFQQHDAEDTAAHQSPHLSFTSKKSVSLGPPAVSLTSPLSTYSQVVSEAEPLSKKTFLDSLDSDAQDDYFDHIAKEPEEGAYLSPLSPSAERLTLSSKVPHRAVQSIKSQLFYEDYSQDLEEDMYVDAPQKGTKRSVLSEALDSSTLKESLNKSELPSFRKDLHPKRILLTSDSLHDSSLSSDLPEYIPPLREKSIPKTPLLIEPQFMPPEEIKATDKSVTSLSLRGARTTYQLVPSSKDVNAELEKISAQHLEEHIPLKSSLLSCTNNSTLDGSAFMSRSFRVGWGPGWTLVHSGTCIGSNEGPPTSAQNVQSSPAPFLFLGSSTSSVQPTAVKGTPRYKLNIEKIHLSNSKPTRNERMDSLLESCLQNVLDLSCPTPSGDFSMDTDSSRKMDPLMQPKKGIELLHRMAGTASRMEDNEDRDRTLSYILELCVSLWGRLEFYNPAVDGKSAYVESQYRKEALSQWLEAVSEEDVAEEVRRVKMDGDKDAYLSAVFSYMSSRQIADACCLAQDNGSHHLALLLSQICLGSDIPRVMMHKQLMYWAEYGIDSFIPLPRLVLYALIAGLPTHHAANVFVNTCEGLDWRRALAMHLWYVCPATATISEALSEYEKACGLSQSDTEPYCEMPRPPYAMEKPTLAECKVNHDICFHLLKLYVDSSHSLDVLLENSSVSPDPLDLTTCWLIWCVLQALDYTLMSESKASSLHLNMASLLEAKGHWHWAAFALLFITDENRRAKEISDLLDRHLLVDGEEDESDPFYREKEHFLLSDLRLPIQRLHEAKSVRAKALKLVDEEAWYSLKCGHYERAHALIVDSIAPNAIVNEDHKYLEHFLKEFEGDRVLAQVAEWENGGGIYKDYLCLVEQIEEMKKSSQLTGSKVESLRPRLLGLCSKLNNLKCSNAVQRLSISEMSRVAVSVLRAILGDNPEATRVLAEQVSSLPLTHECALEELNLITHQYLTHVTMES